MKPQKYLLAITALLVLAALTFNAISSLADESEQVIKITAKKFEYNPNEIKVKKGVPVVLELTSLDRLHGFNSPDLAIRSDINPGQVSTVRFTPQQTGTFIFFCDNFCGEGHDGMTGKIIVED
jgi:cytochrome c oxidase subunit II